jgi:NAD dependent epimerase/dehydratase
MISLKNKKVLVTGAAGFIGSHLTEELVKRGAKVQAFVHYNSRNSYGNLEFLEKDLLKSIEIHSGDITDPFSVDKAVEGCEVVFHLAALIAIPYSYVAPASYVETNVKGTLNVMHACLTHKVEKVIHTSTSETYGTAIYSPIDEKHPLQGQSPYSASKIGADKITESFYCSFNLPVATIRPFNTFGPRQSARAVIPTIISQALVSDTIRLGSLTPVRDFNFVKDTVAGFVLVAESDASVGQVINVGSGREITIGELANKIVAIIGGNKKITTDTTRVRPENSEVMKLLANNSKALSLIGYAPKHTIDEGLALVIDFVRKNPGFYKTDIYNV